MRRLHLGPAALAAILAVSNGGCWVSYSRYAEVLQAGIASESEAERLRLERNHLRELLAEKERRIETLLALGDKRLEKLFHVRKLDLNRTAGVDLDGKAGHDAIRVYVKPIDRDGGTIKAAGSVKVRLFDLAAPQGQTLLGEYSWSVDETPGKWTQLLFRHYRFTCPWKTGPPKNPEVTVRVEFLDYLTGHRFTDQIVCRIALPEKRGLAPERSAGACPLFSGSQRMCLSPSA